MMIKKDTDGACDNDTVSSSTRVVAAQTLLRRIQVAMSSESGAAHASLVDACD
jgi:hypothetical protein